MRTIISPADLKIALDNKEHEVLWDERKVYIVYSKKDVKDAIDLGQPHIYPGNRRMRKALTFIVDHQEKLLSSTHDDFISGPVLIALSTLFVVLVLGLVAILKNTHTSLLYNPKDGTIELITYR